MGQTQKMLLDFPQASAFQAGKKKAEHVKLCYLVKSSAELQPSDGRVRGGVTRF